MCQCVLRGRQGVCRYREGGAQLSLYRGECWLCRDHVTLTSTHRKRSSNVKKLYKNEQFCLLPLSLSFQSCKPHKRSVCGSNAKTYRNHCELHRDACLTGLKIQVAHDGHCQGMSSNTRCSNLTTGSFNRCFGASICITQSVIGL